MIVSRASADQITSSALFVAITLALTAPKAAPIGMSLLAVVCIGLAVVEGFRFQDHNRRSLPSLALSALLAFSAVSLLWAPDPQDAFPHVAFAVFVVISALFFNAWLVGQDSLRLKLMSRAALAAFVLGTTYLTIEIVWHQSLLHWLVSEGYFHTTQARPKNYLSELNRNFAVINLLVWPALFFVTLLGWSSRSRTIFALGLLIVVGIVTLKSAHETSKIAILVGAGLVLLVTLTTAKVARYFLIAAWLATTAATLPVSSFAYHSLHLNDASWLQRSAQRRIVIWAEYTRRTLDYPLIGAGVRAGDAFNRRGEMAEIKDSGAKTQQLSRHPHNGFLQIWFELGVVGAILLFWAAAQAIRDASRTTTRATAYIAASLAAAIPIFGLCWDIWQTWFLASIGIVSIVLLLAYRLGLEDRAPVDASTTPSVA